MNKFGFRAYSAFVPEEMEVPDLQHPTTTKESREEFHVELEDAYDQLDYAMRLASKYNDRELLSVIEDVRDLILRLS